MSVLYLAWRQPGYRWWPVGRLTRLGHDYQFVYTRYRIPFFVHGLRHRPPTSQVVAEMLQPGERLEPRSDPDNPSDPEALAVFARELHIGFAPRYLRRDLNTLEKSSPGSGSLTVVRVNPAPTPMQFRVLAAYEAPWPEDFRPFSEPAFEPLRPDLAAVA